MLEVYGKWKWCMQCRHRVVNVEKQDGRVIYPANKMMGESVYLGYIK